jgi:hypothetical protein
MTPSLRYVVVGFILCTAVPSACSSDSGKRAIAEGCTLNSDCDPGLVCTFSRCHSECKSFVDCPHGSRCVIGDTGKQVCIVPLDDSSCSTQGICAQTLACASDGKCRNTCQVAAACVEGQVCAVGGVCAEKTEVDSTGNLLGAAPDASGTGGGRGSTGGTVGAGGGASQGGGGLGAGGNTADASSGGGPVCQGVLPNGNCSYCPPDSCVNGTCVSGNGDYSCECAPGYAGTGTKTCTIADACQAFLGCPTDYPCVPTQIPGGYSCQGLFASWPMPDRVQGSATAPSYSGNALTVVDNVTGLEWQRATVTNCAVGDAGGTACNQPSAKAYCLALDLGGKQDYRLPTKIELESLLDCTHSVVPYIDTNAFPDTLSADYWTSSPTAGATDEYWYVGFASCGSNHRNGGGSQPIRCVRGTGLKPSTARDHYTVLPVAGDAGSPGEVRDNRTGLTWQGGMGSPQPMQFVTASPLCASLGSGYRLPTEKELLTLVDPSRVQPAIDVGVFPGTAAYLYWTSQGGPFPTTGVSVSFALGATAAADGSGAYTRCVRN